LWLLFVVAALLPLALSDWLSNLAVDTLVDQVYARNSGQVTRQVSRQVFDRLMTGSALLVTFPDSMATLPAGPSSAGARRVPGLGKVFANVAKLAADGSPLWQSDPTANLVNAWARAVPDAAAVPRMRRHEGARVALRVLGEPRLPARVLLGMADDAGNRWIGELSPKFLWQPLAFANDESAWLVRDGCGHTLARYQGADYPRPAAAAFSDAGNDLLESRRLLILRPEFETCDWTFVQRTPGLEARWLGWPLSLWLSMVALATLLAIALAGARQIRQTLVPLQDLTASTRRLAEGEAGARATVRGKDEFADLAHAFNDMAARIETQFDALNGQAAIDHAILAGVPIGVVIERIAHEVRARLPDAGVAIAWIEDDTLATVALGCAVGNWTATLLEPMPLSAPERAAFTDAIDDVVIEPGAVRDKPWLAPHRRHDGAVAVLPVRSHEGTRAMMTIAVPAASAEAPQPARDLRDRLAVAFSAWDRERQLAFRAAHDSLTGLVNRNGLHEYLDAELGRADGPSRHVAVLFVDLDRFKDINDGLGHDAGDELLCLASARLQACVPSGTMVARQGGDEFVVVAPDTDERDACAIAGEVVAQLARPFPLRGADRMLGASVGIAVAPEHGSSRDELLRRADAAMYAAKAAGRGRYALFSEAIDVRARNRVRFQSELPVAIGRGELAVYYQPRVRPDDGVITSVEALVRWQHPQLGLVGPDIFIPLAEESDLIDRLGDWVLDQSCAQMANWRRQGVTIARVAVNVSPRQFGFGHLPDQVKAALARHELAAGDLELEVTESVMVGDATLARAQLAEIRRLGVTIALDDFGTGYSSLASLRQLPIDVMKIDRAFVKDLGQEDADREGALAIIRTITVMARALGMQLVAEGIETAVQADLLAAIGCDEFQGFYYGRPVPAAELALPGAVVDN
jgi:diguanylate cyclase (GGDEF)-like protein